MWAGIAGAVVNNNTGYELAISIHDSVYNTDFASSVIPYTANNPEAQASQIEKHVIDVLRKFCTEHMCKFLGAGVTVSLLREVRLLLNKVCSENASGVVGSDSAPLSAGSKSGPWSAAAVRNPKGSPLDYLFKISSRRPSGQLRLS